MFRACCTDRRIDGGKQFKKRIRQLWITASILDEHVDGAPSRMFMSCFARGVDEAVESITQIDKIAACIGLAFLLFSGRGTKTTRRAGERRTSEAVITSCE